MDDHDVEHEKAREPVLKAIRDLREGRESDARCVFCGGRISVIGSPTGGPFTSFHFTCPCKKSAGLLRGM